MDEDELWFVYETLHATVNATFSDPETTKLVFEMQEQALSLLEDTAQ